MKKIKVLLFAIAMSFSVTSCLEETPLKDDPPVNPVGFQNMQQEFVNATGGKTPASMQVGEWASFQNYAYLYTNNDQIPQGLEAAEVFEVGTGTFTYEDEDGVSHTLPTIKSQVVITEYKDPVHDGDPAEVIKQTQYECPFVDAPYYMWVANCPLPPEQNYWVYYPITAPEKDIFFSLSKYKQRKKLPKKMVDEGRCYGIPNCEIEVTYMEYDVYQQAANGTYMRMHYFTAFSADVPYLASNLLTCFDTLFTLEDGNKHPGKLCKELIDFKPKLD